MMYGLVDARSTLIPDNRRRMTPHERLNQAAADELPHLFVTYMDFWNSIAPPDISMCINLVIKGFQTSQFGKNGGFLPRSIVIPSTS